MRTARAAFAVLVGFLAAAAPALAGSVSMSSSSDGTTVVNGKPCRVVTRHRGDGATSNSSTVTAGNGSVSGNTTISPGGSGAGSSVSVGSGSSSSGTHSSSAAGSDCVIYQNEN